VGGRPQIQKHEKTVFVGCKMNEGLKTELQSISARLGLDNTSFLIRDVLQDFVKNFKKTG
jgi:hypothetical protein